MERDSQGFYQAIYDIVAQIPPGRVATYGQIAAMAGRPGNARQVGFAMSHVPVDRDLPCHRVVNRQGELAPAYAFGGQAKQRALLESEGVTFLPSGRIHLKLHLWFGG